MPKIFYFGLDDKVWHGPVAEHEAQSWYTSGYLFSDVQFQISPSDQFDPTGSVHTLGELIELNGRFLPFYFSPERTNRVIEQEEKLIKLTEEVESLKETVSKYQRYIESDKANVEYDMDALRMQIADLVYKQEDLNRQLSVSGEKENPPIPPELEKKVSNLKMKVDEQEKSFASMKKELSGLNSKCDRNDSKLDKLMESQNVMEGSVNGFDKRITELKASEKSIRESLSACKENFASNSTELTSIQSELSEIKNSMVKGKERSAEFRKVMDKTKEDIDSAWTTIAEHTERLKDVNQTEERLQQEIENVKEAGQKAIQMQSKSAVVAPESMEKNDVPPWEKPRKESPSPKDAEVKKIEDVKEVKKEESCPWDETKVDTEEETMPWNKDKAKVETEVRKSEENKEVKKTEVVKEVKREEVNPWNEDKAKVDTEMRKSKKNKEVKKTEYVIEVEKEEIKPWDKDKTKVDTEVKNGRCPWDSYESQPEFEPWNQMSGSSKKDSETKTGVTSAKNEKVTAGAKSVPQVKNWDKICDDELSDEGEPEAGDAGVAVGERFGELAGQHMVDFFVILRVYCEAMESGNFAALPAVRARFDYTAMNTFFETSCSRASPLYHELKESLKTEMRSLVSTAVYCIACDFTCTTPRHLMYHIEHGTHIDATKKMTPFVAEFMECQGLIVGVFLQFAATMEEIKAGMEGERRLLAMGQRVDASVHDRSRLRPNAHFMTKFTKEVLSQMAAYARCCVPGVDLPQFIALSDHTTGPYKKELTANMRAWLACKANRRKITADFEKHFRGQIANCFPCKVSFESIDEYYQHMTTYSHALLERSSYSMFLSVWKGGDYWNGNL